MTDRNITMPAALDRALELLADPPPKPDVSKGYLMCWALETTPRCLSTPARPGHYSPRRPSRCSRAFTGAP